MNSIKNKYILIAEDDDAFYLWIEIVLQRLEITNITRVKTIEEALVEFDKQHPDLIICDIYLEGKLTGVDFIKKIQHYSIPTIIITSSTSIGLYREVKLVDNVIYLVKPFQPITFIAAIDNSLLDTINNQVVNRQKEPSIFLRMPNNKHSKVYLSDIIYMESDGNYTYIYTQDKKIALKKSLSKIISEFDSRFIRCHRTFAVNKNYVITWTTTHLDLGHISIPLGRRYQKIFENEMKISL